MVLSGKKILITRSAHQAHDFARAVERNGGTAVIFPTIEITPPASWNAADRIIDNLYMYDGLVFTSTNGVEFFFRRLKERNSNTHELKSKLTFVVGKKTQQALEEHGLNVTLMPDKFTAADLSRKLQSEDLHGKTFLFPRGNLGNNILQDNLKLLGANVDAVIVYQTVKPQQHNVDQIRTALLNGEIDVTTFTSPSTFTNFTTLFSNKDLVDVFKKTKIAVIGPVTKEAITKAGMEVIIVAEKSTIESLIQAIIDFYKTIGD